MLLSIAAYVFVGESVGRVLAPNPTLFYALSFLSISTVGSILVVRRTLVFQSETLLREDPDDLVTLARWRAGYIVTYALCEVLALFGLVLRMLGFSLAQVWPYYISGFVLMLFLGPKLPRAELN